jgi:hypothetical protein
MNIQLFFIQINYFKKKIFDIASIMDKLRENFQIKNYQLDLAIKELNRTKEFMLKTSTDKVNYFRRAMITCIIQLRVWFLADCIETNLRDR